MKRATAIAVGLLLSAATAGAQIHPVLERGFSPEKIYRVGNIDSVNGFNGDLIVTLPIGQTYRVAGDLSYGLTLMYNSVLWEYSYEPDSTLPGCSGSQPIDPPGENDCVGLTADPWRYANAGMGWRLSLGDLYYRNDPASDTPILVYVAQDGSQHALVDRLHENETPQDGVWYSRDESYLRLKAVSYGTDGLPDEMNLESADGLIRDFTLVDNKWRLDQIKDRFNNHVDITYSSNLWTITDSQGRTQKVYWMTVAGYTVVDKVELTAFGGGTATYNFGYGNEPTGSSIHRTCKSLNREVGWILTVPLLTTITLPDGSSYKMEDTSGAPAYYDDNLGQVGSCIAPYSGVLKRLVVPTGGVYAWAFDRVEYPVANSSGGCNAGGNDTWQVALAYTTGVTTRSVTSASGDTGTTTYTYPAVTDQVAPYITRTVKMPAGNGSGTYNDTVNYFRTQACQYDTTENGHTAWTGWDYGLPFTNTITSNGLYRSALYYEGSGSGRVAKRASYIKYAHDQLPPLQVGAPRTWYDTNRRVASSAMYYIEDSWKHVDSSSSDFDGLGHYRTVTKSGFSGSGTGTISRTATTQYNPNRGTYWIDPSTNQYLGDFQMLSPGDPWVLGTYSYTEQTQGTVSAKQEYCFSTSTGKLNLTRVFKSGVSRNAHDLLSKFFYNSSGNMTAEEYFGGDQQSLGTGSLCTLSLPAYEYRVDHTYQYGVLSRSQYYSVWINALDRTIDQPTGLPSSTRDVSLFETTYDYDDMGRVTDIKPTTGAWTHITYNKANGEVGGTYTPPSIDVDYNSNGGGTRLAAESFTFDGLGRLTTEKRLLPDGTWGEKLTEYTLAGQLSQASDWAQAGGSHHWTTYSTYDPFGRVRTITQPDGKQVLLAYLGARRTVRNVSIATSQTGETGLTTTTYRDALGRTTEVDEPIDASNSVSTSYLYDVGNRLQGVSIVTPDSYMQTRTFTYDNRGFLTSEQMPEKGSSGNGYVHYYNYDSRGHAHRIVDGSNDLTYTYDQAERLTQIAETGYPSTGYQLLETRAYGTWSGSGHWNKGKLIQAERRTYFWGGSNEFRVDETYDYTGTGGRVSSRTTAQQIVGGSVDTFDQSFTWDDLGVLSSITYPQLEQASVSGMLTSAGPSRTVRYWYTNGFLTAVPGFASSISYYPNGMTNQIWHANDVRDYQGVDAYGMPRPRYIYSYGADTNWSSGNYQYDGAGNIKKIGAKYYVYDGLSRLKQGQAYGAGSSAITRQYTYDGFGNMTSIWSSDTGQTRSWTVNHNTNRLSAVSYDAAGNQLSWGSDGESFTYKYTPFNQVGEVAGGSPYADRVYGYTADGERLAHFDSDVGGTTYTLRDLEGHVLRKYVMIGTTWTWKEDYVWGPNGLLATISPTEGTKHYTLDHLGSPRLVCDRCAHMLAQHNYFPFGEEATNQYQDTEQMKFTGHERDLGLSDQTTDDLDYMHARHFNMHIGRFLSVDPGDDTEIGKSQSWNLYAYTRDNPIKFLDRNGRKIALATKGNWRVVKRYLVRTAMRPSGRAWLARAAADSKFLVVFSDSRINHPVDIQHAIKDHVPSKLTLGQTTPTPTGATVELDTVAILRASRDSSGVTTTSHEGYHERDVQAGKTWAETAKGDYPTSETGPAEKFGEQVRAEKPDMTSEEARKLVDKWLEWMKDKWKDRE